MSTSRAYLALGANMGDPRTNLRAAVRMIGEGRGTSVAAVSSLYLTKPVGIEDQPDFLNAAVAVDTTLTPHELLDLCSQIEERLGRQRTIRWGPRVIDVDILLYDALSVQDADLVIPHPRMLDRAFALAPLAELAPDAEIRPGLTVREAAERVDASGVSRVEEGSWCR